MTRTSPDAFGHDGDRSEQEDAFLTASREGAVLCAVCDAGGGGGCSSRPAADLVIARLREAFDAGLDPAGVSEVIQSAHHALLDRAEAGERSMRWPESAWRYMFTTADVALFVPGRAYLAHVGDGRIYRMRGANLERLTVDHDLRDERRRASPDISAEDLEKVPLYVLARGLGMRRRDLEVDSVIVETQPADTFLLCSDGLFRQQLPDDAIAELLLRTAGQVGAARTLVEAALLAPRELPMSRDNMTAVIHRVGVGGL
jgi:serine/threonine protein phosphatase PrpC